jgi:hypothetical protein
MSFFFKKKKQITILVRQSVCYLLAWSNKSHQLFFHFISVYGGQLIFSDTLIEFLIIILNISLCIGKITPFIFFIPLATKCGPKA